MKETTMKCFDVFRRALLVSCATLGTVGLLLPSVTLADGKGASKLMKVNTVSTSQTQSVSSSKPAMSCPRCKDALVAVTERSPKGMHVNSVKNVPMHLCSACATKIATVGSGKAKADRVEHTCGNSAGALASCCMAASK